MGVGEWYRLFGLAFAFWPRDWWEGRQRVLWAAATYSGIPARGSPGVGLECAQVVFTVSTICKKRSCVYLGKQDKRSSGDYIFSQALFFPSLFLTGSGGQFLPMCLLVCLRDLIAVLPARAFIAQLADQTQPCTWSYRQACPGPGPPH